MGVTLKVPAVVVERTNNATIKQRTGFVKIIPDNNLRGEITVRLTYMYINILRTFFFIKLEKI